MSLVFLLMFCSCASTQTNIRPFGLLPDDLKNVFLNNTDTRFVLYYDAYVHNTEVVYKKFVEAYYDIAISRSIVFTDVNELKFNGVLNSIDKTSLQVWVTDQKGNIVKYVAKAPYLPKVVIVDNPDEDKIYVKVSGLPENFYRLSMSVNYSITNAKYASRSLIITVTPSQAFESLGSIPFTHLPMYSLDGGTQFIRVLSKSVKTTDDGNYLDYVFFVAKDNIPGLVVDKIDANSFTFYLNEDEVGRVLTEAERKNIFIEVTNDRDGNFLINMKNVPEKIFRLSMSVDIVYNGIHLVTVFEFMSSVIFPKNPSQNDNVFFDKVGYYLAKIITVD